MIVKASLNLQCSMLLVVAGVMCAPAVVRADSAVGTQKLLADAKLLPKEAQNYALTGPEIYKVNRRSKDLTIEDLNGDGLLDILVTSNEKSILEIFYQRKKSDENKDPFDKQTVAVDRIIRSVATADVNGDGRTDLLMATSPPKLIVMYQDDKGRLQTAQDTPLEADRVIMGDLYGDKKRDALVYQQGRFDILKATGRELTLEPNETFYTTGEPASDPMIIDFDGDGRNDIVYHDANQFDDLVVRLQSPEKTFPSEFRLHTAVLRTATALPRGKGEAGHVIAVQNVSREIVELALAEETTKTKDGEFVLSDEQIIPFDPETKSAKSTPFVTDFDGDGRKDLIIYSPDLSVLRLLHQSRAGSLVESTIPSLQGIESVMALDAEKGEATPLVMFSSSEKAIGFAKYDSSNKTLPFPSVLPISGQPEGVAVLKINGKETLAAILKVDGTAELQLSAFEIDAAGKVGEGRNLFPTENFKSPLTGLDVTGMEAIDVNRDDKKDLLVYADFKPAVMLIHGDKGIFTPVNATSGVLQGLLQGAKATTIDSANLTKKKDETTVLALKEKFARAFHIDKDMNVDVEQQFNGRNSAARLVGMGIGHLKTKDDLNVVLLDKGNKVLTIYGPKKDKPEEFEIITNVDLDDADYTSLNVLDLDDDGKDDVVLTSDDRVGIYYSRPITGKLETVATAKTTVDDGGYGKAYVADIIPGGDPEIVGLEMKDQLMELFAHGLNAEKKPTLNRYYQFRMFDSETTIARRVNMDALPEPRELLAADLDEDGVPEIVTVMHDNIIIYRVKKQ